MKRWKRFFSYYKPYKGLIFADLFFAFVLAAISLAIPYITSYITKHFLTNGDITFETVMILMAGLLVLLLVEFGSNVFVTYVGHYTGTLIEADLREELFVHYQKLSFTFYDNNKTGQLMSRLTNDLFSLTELYHHGPEDIILSFVKLIGSFIILIIINPALTAICYAIIPVMVLFILYYNKRMNRIFLENKKYIAEINEQLEDNLNGIRVVKSFANETIEVSKFKEGNKKFVKSKKDRYKLMGNYHAGLSLFSTGFSILILFVGVILVHNGSTVLDASTLLLYLLYVSNISSAVRQFIAFFETFQEGWTGFCRFYDLTLIDGEDTLESPNPIELKDVKGEIVFKNVSFKYKTSKELVLKNFDLKIESGKYIALVGKSGVGKSTICSLIPRFYDVTEGNIYIDNKDIKDVSLKSLRDNIGIVQQNVYLFNETVYDNILYGKPDATYEEVVEASRRANALEFIESLPDGFNTDIGQRGVKLSGGQKQRLSIARVFLKNPPILIFDEATSSLDNESEYVIQESLEELAKGRTTLVIAHRLSTIRNAETIYVVDESGIVEEGNHEELLKNGKEYASLYNRNF